MGNFGKPWSIQDLENHMCKRPEQRVVSSKAVSAEKVVTGNPVTKKPKEKRLFLTFNGQIRGGKNNYLVTRQGKHIPKQAWADWRDERVHSLRNQLPENWTPIDVQISVRLRYVAGDKRRRDMPAIIDSIWHCLEKAGVCTDDTNLWIVESSREYDKNNGRAELSLIWCSV